MERCLLLENAQKLAKQKHLNTSEVRCGVMASCQGTVCIYLADEISENPTQGQDRFYQRLQARRDLRSQGERMARPQ